MVRGQNERMRNAFETDERLAFRASIARFVENEIRPNADAWDEAGTFPFELHQKAGALGLYGIDEAYGGLGVDDAFLRAVSGEELGRAGAWPTCRPAPGATAMAG